MKSVFGLRLVGTIVAAFVLLGVAAPAVAQEEWESKYSLGVFAIGAGMEGYLQAPYAPNRQRVYFSDLSPNFSTGGGISFEMKQVHWSVLSDLVFISFNETIDGVKVDGDQLYIELCSTVKLSSTFSLLAGARYTDLNSDLTFPGTPTPYERKIDSAWVDPIVGGMFVFPMGKSWALMMRGDVGGFGLASDIVWHAQVRLDGKLGKAATFSLGYRYWDNNFENFDDPQTVGYDMTVAGPTVGIAFNF
jgi:hypothetical protein